MRRNSSSNVPSRIHPSTSGVARPSSQDSAGPAGLALPVEQPEPVPLAGEPGGLDLVRPDAPGHESPEDVLDGRDHRLRVLLDLSGTRVESASDRDSTATTSPSGANATALTPESRRRLRRSSPAPAHRGPLNRKGVVSR